MLWCGLYLFSAMVIVSTTLFGSFSFWEIVLDWCVCMHACMCVCGEDEEGGWHDRQTASSSIEMQASFVCPYVCRSVCTYVRMHVVSWLTLT